MASGRPYFGRGVANRSSILADNAFEKNPAEVVGSGPSPLGVHNSEGGMELDPLLPDSDGYRENWMVHEKAE